MRFPVQGRRFEPTEPKQSLKVAERLNQLQGQEPERPPHILADASVPTDRFFREESESPPPAPEH